MVLPFVDQNVFSHLELIVGPFEVSKRLRPCLLVMQRTVDKVPIRFHFLNPVSDLDNLVTFQSDLVEIRNIEPEMRVISEVQVEVAHFSVRCWCVVDGDLDHVQLSQPIVGRPHIRLLLLRQDNCPQVLPSWSDWFSPLHRWLGRGKVKAFSP